MWLLPPPPVWYRVHRYGERGGLLAVSVGLTDKQQQLDICSKNGSCLGIISDAWLLPAWKEEG